MARPRNLEFPEGIVSLNGFPKELADKLEEHILTFNSSQQVVTTTEPVSQMTDKAIGLRRNKDTNVYEVVVVKYDADTKEAQVDTVKSAGEWRDIAIANYKMEIIALGLFG